MRSEAILLTAAVGCFGVGACEADRSPSDDAAQGGGGAHSEGEGGSAGGLVGTGGHDGGVGGACAGITESADNKVQPADIILAIDQSKSMDDETAWVTQQLSGFAQQIIAAMIDVHVVVIAGKPGSDNGFCIPAPLGSGACPADDNLPTFMHVDQHVSSNDALHQILAHYGDYQSMLRIDATKHLIVISDDDAGGITAADFNAQLLALDPAMFQGYTFHAIVADSEDPGTVNCLINPEPCCDVAADEGTIYKQLIQMTGGLFGDLCQQDFQPVWDEVSTQVISNATIACEWDIPAPPAGESFNAGQVNVEYSVDGATASLGQVESAADCSQYDDGWYYDDPSNPTKILVCPDTCDMLQSADQASVAVTFGCSTIPASPK